jgi:hypothetical protein
VQASHHASALVDQALAALGSGGKGGASLHLQPMSGAHQSPQAHISLHLQPVSGAHQLPRALAGEGQARGPRAQRLWVRRPAPSHLHDSGPTPHDAAVALRAYVYGPCGCQAVMLVRNYRSAPPLLELPSRLFYDRALKASCWLRWGLTRLDHVSCYSLWSWQAGARNTVAITCCVWGVLPASAAVSSLAT